MHQIQWQDRFNIGGDAIDEAHRKLFSIVQKIMELYVEQHKNKFACVEGIKYFKSYALKHFTEEEAYMREIGYSGYLSHKRAHDRMRRETLPALERELYSTNFSAEAVQQFIGVCTGWLTGHIMIEDRAITGKIASELTLPAPDDELSLIRAVILCPLQEILGIPIQYLGHFSAQDTISDAQYYELTYLDQRGSKLQFILIIGEQPLIQAAGLMFGIELNTINEITRFAIQEIAQSLIHRAAACFGEEPNAYRLVEDHFLKAVEYRQEFREHPPQFSLLFSAEQACFVLCINQVPAV